MLPRSIHHLAFCDVMVDAKEGADIEVFGFCLMSKVAPPVKCRE